ncbi:XRE family transcriptional regulator [Proteus myxofaciens]|uniref:Uncharacterized protein n=1 Tax=Proteus myxofaciens ATCC 19692 TaxID=1354337 RepID=A0A198FSK9_9GAMM|nr:XRE family transcriptional regulator [Proteus myxofaciens]OAT27106.1 hypothetical protein M983_1922 [Proteus myxofaciens ATCC 19692]
MNKVNQLTCLYKSPQNPITQESISNDFTDALLQTKTVVSATFDKLAYLAGIKNAPADDKYSKLNTANLTTLLESAKELGYDIEVMSF